MLDVEHEPALKAMQTKLDETHTTTKEILKLLQGNGVKGVFTRLALVEVSLGRVWWWIGGISTCVVMVCAGIVKVGLGV